MPINKLKIYLVNEKQQQQQKPKDSHEEKIIQKHKEFFQKSL